MTDPKSEARKVAEILDRPYEIRLNKDPAGGYFVRVAEWPGCMSQGETIEEAAANIREAMRLWVETNLELGEEIPAPNAETPTPSGKFVVRIPKSLHRRLSDRAGDEGISLNTLVVSFLSDGLARKEERVSIMYVGEWPVKVRREEFKHVWESRGKITFLPAASNE